MVTVVIVTYNGMRWIKKCLDSVLASDINQSIILVDNASTDSTPDFISKDYPSIELIQCRRNMGFGKANNIGIRKAYLSGANHVLLLNQDAYLETDTLRILINISSKNPDYGIISPIHLDGSGVNLDKGFETYITHQSQCRLVNDILIDSHRLADVYNLGFVNAACWLVTKKAIEEVGGFNPYFFHYSEDWEYSYRLQARNFKVGVVPNCYVIHDRKQEASEFRNKMLQYSQVELEFFKTNPRFTVSTRLTELRKRMAKAIVIGNISGFKTHLEEFRYLNSRKNIIQSCVKAILKKETLVFLTDEYLTDEFIVAEN